MKTPLKALFLATFLAGCTSPLPPRDAGWYWASYRNFDYQCLEESRAEWIRACNERASNSSEDRETRLGDIFTLFRRFVRPGFTSATSGEIMRGAKWLDEAEIEPVRALGGYIPVEHSHGDSVFSMTLPRDKKVHDTRFIYFTLIGLEPKGLLPWEQCREKAREFFKGELHDNRVRLHEFALSYPREPLCQTERFTERGAGLMVR